MTNTDRLNPLDFLVPASRERVRQHAHQAFSLHLRGSGARLRGGALVEAKLADIPRYRQVVRFVPMDLGRPVWADDPHFNLDFHVRHTALPAPGGAAELRRLVARVMSQQLDRSRPLWEMWITEGLDDGRWALVSKVHHAMVDGVSGAELLSTVLDISPDAEPGVATEWEPRPAPSSVELATEAVAQLVKSPYEQFRALRAAGRVPRQALNQLQGRYGPQRRWRPSVGTPEQPERADRAAPPTRVGVGVGRRHQDGARRPRRIVQRRGAGDDHPGISQAAARAGETT
ncbi:MAG: wax ester/triacylglycerol synthase family O-acyltransferase [Microthrixaceae bacterium]